MARMGWEGGGGCEPAQADTRCGGFAGREAAGTGEVGAYGVGVGEAVGPGAVRAGD